MTDKDKPTVGVAPDVPDASNSRLRDARLTQALPLMHDAHMKPSAQARLAVLQHAQEAVAGRSDSATPKAGRWWQRLLGAPWRQSSSHAAWGGALACVLVASFITLMWCGQPVSDANPDMPAALAKQKAQSLPCHRHQHPRRLRRPLQPAPFNQRPRADFSQTQPLPSARSDMPMPRLSAAPAPISKAGSETIDIQSSDPTSSTVLREPAGQADALLAYLRNLRDLRTPVAKATGQATEETATLAADAVVTPITVRTAQGELWEIWPTQVHLKTGLTPDPKTDAVALTSRFFTISALQYDICAAWQPLSNRWEKSDHPGWFAIGAALTSVPPHTKYDVSQK